MILKIRGGGGASGAGGVVTIRGGDAAAITVNQSENKYRLENGKSASERYLDWNLIRVKF